MISIIIPAHNEEAVISRVLAALLDGDAPGELEVIVACNGCTDRTAEAARRFGPPVRVIEIPAASKVAALNAGDAVAAGFPRFYVDADVELPLDSVRRMAAALDRGPALAAWPEPRTELLGASWPVRAFYAVWLALPYNRAGGRVGAGVYALSREGRARFARFPDVINDDGFVRFRFAPHERMTVPGAWSQVQAPRTLAALVRVKTRVRVGQFQLRQRYPDAPASEPKSVSALFRAFARRPWLWPCVPVYAAVTLYVRRQARRRLARAELGGWGRDGSTREADGGRLLPAVEAEGGMR